MWTSLLQPTSDFFVLHCSDFNIQRNLSEIIQQFKNYQGGTQSRQCNHLTLNFPKIPSKLVEFYKSTELFFKLENI